MKKTMEINGEVFEFANLSKRYAGYVDLRDIYDVYGRPSITKVDIYNDWTIYTWQIGATTPSVQTFNTFQFTLAFFATVNGEEYFFFITPNRNYIMKY